MWIRDIDEFIGEIEKVEKNEENQRMKEYEKMKKKVKLKPHNYVKEMQNPKYLSKE